MKLKILAIAALLFASTASQAAYLDVIAVKMKAACSVADFIKLGKATNEWAKAYEYVGEVLTPVMSDQPTTYAWVGRSPSVAAFGKTADAWQNGIATGDATITKLSARWIECTETVYRRGYSTH